MAATNIPSILAPPVAGIPATNAVAVQDIRAARPPVAIPSLWGWLLGLGLLLGMAAAALVAWRRHRRQQNRPPPEIVIPPYRRALERLRAALDLLHRPERFCVAVSDTLRTYLEERFQWHAPERTTEEFLAEIQAGPNLSSIQRTLLADFLSRCDLVKFARYEPAEPELRDLYDAAVRLVEETEPLLNLRTAVAATPGAAAPPAAPAPAT